MNGFKTHPAGGDVTMRGEAFVAPDVKHSGAEDRLLAIGRDKNMWPCFIAYTYRTRAGKRLIRPVSARSMHKKEIERYET